jgi:hypothetical protein
MSRVIRGDDAAGWEFFNNVLCRPGMSYHETKRQQLLEFGIPEIILAQWEARDPVCASYGEQLIQVLGTMDAGMERMRPDGVTRLGRYASGIGDLLAERSIVGTVVDFGCGAWVDATIYFASRLDMVLVRLVDVRPLSLAFSSWQLDQRGIGHETFCEKEDGPAGGLYFPNSMIVESSAFEHVPGIRALFPKMMDSLSPGGLFLTNYTYLDWTNPAFDCYQENKDAQGAVIADCLDMAYRYQWDPPQDPVTGWDLWERK